MCERAPGLSDSSARNGVSSMLRYARGTRPLEVERSVLVPPRVLLGSKPPLPSDGVILILIVDANVWFSSAQGGHR